MCVITTNIQNLRARHFLGKDYTKSCRRIKSASIPTVVRAVMPLIFNVEILMMFIGTVGGVGFVVLG
jgi:hypothetical protein